MNNTKKKFVVVGLASIITLAILMITGCGYGNATPEVQVVEKEVVKEVPVYVTTTPEVQIVEKVVEKEVVKEVPVYVTTTPEVQIVEKVVEKENTSDCNSDLFVFDYGYNKKINERDFDLYDITQNLSSKIDGFYYTKDYYVDDPYYVGKQSSSFLESVSGKYDVVVFLDMPLNMAVKYNLNGKYTFISSDSTVGYVDNKGVFYPESQGLTTVSICKDGKVVKTVNIAVTTYNDGKSANYSGYKTSDMSENVIIDRLGNLYNPDTARLTVNTVDDMIKYLIGKWWVYDDHMPDCKNTNHWWQNIDGRAELTENRGVCTDVANAACYALQNNYEDWGFILIVGKYGHVFNWFYEDGRYIIVDFTQVISDNAMGEFRNRDRNRYIHEFKTVDEIRKWFPTQYNYVNDKTTAVAYMYSAQGHSTQNTDYNPNYNFNFYDNWDVVVEGAVYEIGVEAIQYDEMEIIFKSNFVNANILRVENSDQPIQIKVDGQSGIYNDEERMNVWFKY